LLQNIYKIIKDCEIKRIRHISWTTLLHLVTLH
jgi:hypothetical protein